MRAEAPATPECDRLSIDARGLIAGALLASLAVLMPLALWLSGTRLAGWTYGKDAQLFELFGFFAAAALLGAAAVRLSRSAGLPAGRRVVALLPLALGVLWVGLVSEVGWFHGDWWSTYQKGAAAIAAGKAIYSLETTYIFYPPLLAEVLFEAHRVVLAVTSWAVGAADGDRAWWITFYLFQCAQVGLIMLAYPLLAALGRCAGLRAYWPEALAAGVLVLNNPLLRTVRWGQVNLWVLDLTVLGVLCSARWPALAGAALALAVHLKLYPLIAVVSLVLMRRWRAVVWTVAAAVGVVAAEASLFGAAHWRQFFGFVPDWPQVVPFRSSSALGVLLNLLNLVAGVEGRALEVATRAGVLLAGLAVAAWFLARALLREAGYRRAGDGGGAAERAGKRVAGHAADALAFGLLVSPLAWEHHFVFAMPLAVVAAGVAGRRSPVPLVVAAALMLAFPTFDLFPASYVRLAGLLALLVMTSPRRSGAAAVG